MARAHYVTYALDTEGRPIANATVYVREPGTTTLISHPIFDSDTSVTPLGNPINSDATGKIELYLGVPKIVDLYVVKTGYDPVTIRGTVMQLNASDLVIQDSGVSLPQRSVLDFRDAFVVNDNAGALRTEVNLEYGGSAELKDVATTRNVGTSPKVSRADHVHAHPVFASGNLHSEYLQSASHTKAAHEAMALAHSSLAGLGNDEHSQYLKEKGSGGLAVEVPAHTHANADNAGLVANDSHNHTAATVTTHSQAHTHASLTGIGPDDHHPKFHDPRDHDFIGVQAVKSSNQSVSSGIASPTQITFSGVTYDTNAIFNNTNDSFVLPYAGFWRVKLNITFAQPGAACDIRAIIRRNGVAVVDGMARAAASGGDRWTVTAEAVLSCAANDAFTFMAAHNDSSTLAAVGNGTLASSCWAECSFLGV